MGTEEDYSMDLAFFGMGIGGYVGYVLRPSFYYEKLSITQIIQYVIEGRNLGYLNPIAETSFHYIVAGALLGIVAGWGLGKHLKNP